MKKKATPFEQWLLEAALQKFFPEISKNSQGSTCVQSLSNTVKGHCAFRRATLLKRDC